MDIILVLLSVIVQPWVLKLSIYTASLQIFWKRTVFLNLIIPILSILYQVKRSTWNTGFYCNVDALHFLQLKNWFIKMFILIANICSLMVKVNMDELEDLENWYIRYYLWVFKQSWNILPCKRQISGFKRIGPTHGWDKTVVRVSIKECFFRQRKWWFHLVIKNINKLKLNWRKGKFEKHCVRKTETWTNLILMVVRHAILVDRGYSFFVGIHL